MDFKNYFVTFNVSRMIMLLMIWIIGSEIPRAELYPEILVKCDRRGCLPRNFGRALKSRLELRNKRTETFSISCR